jgi:hypothetical protein
MWRRVVIGVLLTTLLSSALPNANAEQLRRYKIQYPDGTYIMNSGTSNPIVVEGYPSVYSTIVFTHDPRGIDNSVCASGCRPVLDDYQSDNTEGTPSTPSTPPTPSTPIIREDTKAQLTEIQIEIYQISQNQLQWTLDAYAGKSRTVLYTNFSYSWKVTGPSGEVDSGKSIPNAIAESSAGMIASFNLTSLQSGTPYVVSVEYQQSGSFYQVSRTITTKNAIPAAPILETATPILETATPILETATPILETATPILETATAIKSESEIKSELVSGVIQQISLTSSVKQKMAIVGTYFATFSKEEKEDLLFVIVKKSGSSIIIVATDFANLNMTVTATKKGQKTVVFNVKTDKDGDIQIKTNANLNGFTVSLNIGAVKLDADLVKY